MSVVYVVEQLKSVEVAEGVFVDKFIPTEWMSTIKLMAIGLELKHRCKDGSHIGSWRTSKYIRQDNN